MSARQTATAYVTLPIPVTAREARRALARKLKKLAKRAQQQPQQCKEGTP